MDIKIDELKDIEVEDLRNQLVLYPNVFAYAASCERNFERNLRSDYSRKTTFFSDFSIAEWCGGKDGVIDTFQRAINDWKSNIEYFAELILCVNIKAWEHFDNGNSGYADLYSNLYYIAKDAYFDTFKGNEEAMQYYYDFID